MTTLQMHDFKLEEADKPFLILLKTTSIEQYNVLMAVYSEFLTFPNESTIKPRYVPYAVVATNLKIKVNTVKSRLSRARHKIITWRRQTTQVVNDGSHPEI